jgi:chromosome segregation ATPase
MLSCNLGARRLIISGQCLLEEIAREFSQRPMDCKAAQVYHDVTTWGRGLGAVQLPVPSFPRQTNRERCRGFAFHCQTTQPTPTVSNLVTATSMDAGLHKAQWRCSRCHFDNAEGMPSCETCDEGAKPSWGALALALGSLRDHSERLERSLEEARVHGSAQQAEVEQLRQQLASKAAELAHNLDASRSQITELTAYNQRITAQEIARHAEVEQLRRQLAATTTEMALQAQSLHTAQGQIKELTGVLAHKEAAVERISAEGAGLRHQAAVQQQEHSVQAQSLDATRRLLAQRDLAVQQGVDRAMVLQTELEQLRQQVATRTSELDAHKRNLEECKQSYSEQLQAACSQIEELKGSVSKSEAERLAQDTAMQSDHVRELEAVRRSHLDELTAHKKLAAQLAATLQGELEQLRRQAAEKISELDLQTRNVGELCQQRDQLQGQVAELTAQKEEKEAVIAQTEKKVAELMAQNEEKEAFIAEIKKELQGASGGIGPGTAGTLNFVHILCLAKQPHFPSRRWFSCWRRVRVRHSTIARWPCQSQQRTWPLQ